MRRDLAVFAGAVSLAALTALPAHAANQGAGSSASEPVLVVPEPQHWGIASEHELVVHPQDLMPATSAVTFSNGQGAVFETSASGDWWGGVHLPTGALVLRIEMEACDTDAAGAILFGMARFNSPGATGGTNVTPIGTTGATPGCGFFNVNVTTPFTIDNDNQQLTIFLNYGSTTNTNRVNLFRVYYRLQVSPAPATATFTDVPVGHPFLRFVEALVASGVTGGCGGGNYCPDSPVTRGQMAVFLATALGMHFAP